MKSLVDFINENIIIEVQKIAKDVDPKLENFIKEFCVTNKKSLGKPKKLVVYPDGIGIHDKEFEDKYNDEPYLSIKSKDYGDFVDIPDVFYKEISNEFLNKVYVTIELPCDVIEDSRPLDKIYKNMHKIDCLRLCGLIRMSSTGKEKDLLSIDDIEKFLKKYKTRDNKIYANARIEDLEGWDPKVVEFEKEFEKMLKKYNVGTEFVLSSKSYREIDVPKRI